MKKFSVTTALGWAQAACTFALLGKPVYNYFTVQNWDAVKETIAATAITTLVNGAFAAVRGHFIQDAIPPKGPPSPPADSQ